MIQISEWLPNPTGVVFDITVHDLELESDGGLTLFSRRVSLH